MQMNVQDAEAVSMSAPLKQLLLMKKREFAVVDQDECVECGACEEACPNQAIKVEE